MRVRHYDCYSLAREIHNRDRDSNRNIKHAVQQLTAEQNSQRTIMVDAEGWRIDLQA